MVHACTSMRHASTELSALLREFDSDDDGRLTKHELEVDAPRRAAGGTMAPACQPPANAHEVHLAPAYRLRVDTQAHRIDGKGARPTGQTSEADGEGMPQSPLIACPSSTELSALLREFDSDDDGRLTKHPAAGRISEPDGEGTPQSPLIAYAPVEVSHLLAMIEEHDHLITDLQESQEAIELELSELLKLPVDTARAKGPITRARRRQRKDER